MNSLAITSRFTKYLLQLFVTLTLFVSLSSCSIKEVEVGTIQSFEIEEVTKEHIVVNISAPVRNENAFSFSVRKANLNITFNDIDLGEINEIRPIKIEGNSNEIQHFIFKVKLEDLGSEGFLLIPSLLSNKAHVGVKGYFKASKFLFTKKVEMDYNKTISLNH